MINILYYESSSGFGGSSSNLYHILRQLDKTKYFPTVIVHQDGDQFERIKTLGINVIKISYPELDAVNKAGGIKLMWMYFSVIRPMSSKLYKIIKEQKIDLIHINTNILLGIPMILAAKRAGKKVFCYIRESRALIRREKHFVPDIHQFLILNHQAIDIYKRDIPINKLNVIYDGVDLTEFNNLNSEHFINEFNLKGIKTVGIVGRIIRGKGQFEFVRTAKKVCQQFSNVKFLVVGDAKGEQIKYLDEIKSFVQKEHLEDKIIFTGWRTDVKEIINVLDILVLASTTFPEGLPNTIIEAMALAKPAVGTDIPGPPEIIKDGVTGFIVPPGDTIELAEKIVFLLAHEDEALKMGQSGRQRVEELFDVKKVVKKIQSLYETELNR
ncbi:MAG: glycosyltransferase [Candidatus Omnitrophica bacterium]|nr:glycosyltransferase [Candidatus Omnitrophota bacterium]